MGSAERSEVDIYSVFNIMSGTEMGGCDAYLDELTAWFHDCVELVDAASTCANSPKWEDAEYRRGYFHLSPDQDVEPITGKSSRCIRYSPRWLMVEPRTDPRCAPAPPGKA